MQALLISTYELGRQPFGLASPAAWLRRAGASVTCLDLSREPLREEPVRAADFIAFFVPMHTAARLAIGILPSIRKLNPRAHLCFYGLYAPVNEGYLRKLGAETILGGEFEQGLVTAFEHAQRSHVEAKLGQPSGAPKGGRAAPGAAGGTSPDAIGSPAPRERRSLQPESLISLARQRFLVPDRSGLPLLSRYAHLNLSGGEQRVVGYTEASRGCKHLCLHCPVVPVYGGHFRIVQPDIVLEDIRRQVAAGAEHITFGDPDFFNGIRHAISIVSALHEEHPILTYDVTIKISHLLEHAQHLSTLHATGCLFVTSAVEAIDDGVLERLDKGHTCADFVSVVELCREVGLILSPTFVAFTPWTTLEGYCELLTGLAELDLVEKVAPIQLAIRLLIPAGSRLLELDEVRELIAPFDEAALVYPWAHPDSRVDKMGAEILALVQAGEKRKDTRRAIFERVWRLAHEFRGLSPDAIPEPAPRLARDAVPYLTEPWYC